MRKESIDQLWSAGNEGDVFALTAMGILLYEGKQVQRNLEQGLALLEHAAQQNVLWARDNYYFAKQRLRGNPALTNNVLLGKDAMDQMKYYASEGNIYARTLLGHYLLTQPHAEGDQQEGMQQLNIAILNGCLWAKDVLQDCGITSNVTAKADPLEGMGPGMRAFAERALGRRFGRYGLSDLDIQRGIKSACDFFGLNYPMMVEDLTHVEYGATMFCNANKRSTADDILCYNLEELRQLNVRTPVAFTLVMTHECAHRALQNVRFGGVADGKWNEEMACDFFMGVRAAMQQLDIRDVLVGFQNDGGGAEHPTGELRVGVISFGYQHAIELARRGQRLTFEGLLNDVAAYLDSIEDEMRSAYMQVCFRIVHKGR